jgi:hypothetical protein
MSDDLVKRLRYEQDRLDDEAADRIEKLEAALRLWACDCEAPCTKGRCEAYQAKIALEGKQNDR